MNEIFQNKRHGGIFLVTDDPHSFLSKFPFPITISLLLIYSSSFLSQMQYDITRPRSCKFMIASLRNRIVNLWEQNSFDMREERGKWQGKKWRKEKFDRGIFGWLIEINWLHDDCISTAFLLSIFERVFFWQIEQLSQLIANAEMVESKIMIFF